MARTNGGLIGKRNVTSFGKCKVTSITSTGNHTTQPGSKLAEAIIVAGGGAGGPGVTGGRGGGGGGGGGLISKSVFSVCGNTAYPLTIGAGGGADSSGNNSVGFGCTAIAGGKGAGSPVTGSNGGSGGGGTFPGGSGGSGTCGQGNAGGVAGTSSPNNVGGGGGGAGGAGASGALPCGPGRGKGGAGGPSTITGACVKYAGGGGNGIAGGSLGTACCGGGGGGGYPGAGAYAGCANTGGGGGGSGRCGAGGSGGSGIVVVRYNTSTGFVSYSDMTLVSNATTAEAVPTKGDLVLTYTNGAGTATINTDIKGWVSRDNGTTYTQFTLTDDGDTGGHTILTAHDLDISAQPSGTAMRYKITTHNQSAAKQTRIQAVSLGWS